MEFDRRNVSRTYLLLDSEAYESGEMRIAAYFSLAIKPMVFAGTTSKSAIKRIDGFSKDAESVGAVVIGQLGKCSLHGNEISGAEIINNAFVPIQGVFNAVGGRIVFLECQPERKVIAFYEQNGFAALQTNERTGLLQMVRLLKMETGKYDKI